MNFKNAVNNVNSINLQFLITNFFILILIFLNFLSR